MYDVICLYCAIIHVNMFRNFICYIFFASASRHTIWPRDWSSDVCSSDLGDGPGLPVVAAARIRERGIARTVVDRTDGADGAACVAVPIGTADTATAALSLCLPARAGRLDRKSVVEGKRGELEGRIAV